MKANLYSVALLLSLTSLSGAAEEAGVPGGDHGPQEHSPLDIDRGLEWAAVLDRALDSYPRYVELEARRAEAEALRARGDSLLAGRPSVALSYRSDDSLDDYGLAEYEAGLTLPLWRLGQRHAASELGTAAAGEAAAARAALRWEVAGALREALWDIEDAVNAVELAADALAVATDIERIVARRHAVGDLPLEDTLLAESAVLDRRTALVEQRARLVDAEFSYQMLTTLSARPAALVESLTERRDFTSSHPLLALADAEVERAGAQLELTAREARGSPTLSIGPRRQRDPLTTFYADSVGVGVSIPFGGEAHVAASTAAAQRRLAEAEAQHAAIERRLHAELHEALHTLETTQSALALAEQKAELSERHRQMGRTAFEQGEISLVELLRRDEAAQAAARQARSLEVELGRSIAAVNQAVGELP